MKVKAEITSFNVKYCMISIKLWLRVATIKKASLRAVAGAKGFWVAELRVWKLKIVGRKSCFAF